MQCPKTNNSSPISSIASPRISSNPPALKLGYCNADGLLDNIATVHEFISFNNLHILCVSETWLTANSDVFFEGYNVFRNDRGLINLDSGKDTRGGGVAIIVCNNLSVTVVAMSKVRAIGQVEFLII